jgi:hypothetical protein
VKLLNILLMAYVLTCLGYGLKLGILQELTWEKVRDTYVQRDYPWEKHRDRKPVIYTPAEAPSAPNAEIPFDNLSNIG